MRYWIAAVLIVIAAPASGQLKSQSKPVPVFVSQSGKDAVGQALAYAVREELRRSEGYEVAVARDALFTIGIVSLDAALRDDDEGHWSAVAVTYTMTNLFPYVASNPQTWYQIYLTTTVLTVGRNRVDAVAKNIVADLDSEVQGYRDAASIK